MKLKLEINTRFGRLKHHASVGESSCNQLMVDQCSHSNFGQLLVPACMDIGSGLKGEMDCSSRSVYAGLCVHIFLTLLGPVPGYSCLL